MSTVPQDTPTVANTQSDNFISFEEYMRYYYHAEDGFKYEWNNGKLEKTAKMDAQQSTLQDVLTRIFIKTDLFQQGGMLVSETDMKTSERQFRRPDLSIYTSAQKKKMKKGDKNQVPLWVGEVISEFDNANKINDKLDEYFAAGVKVVWNIYILSDQVYVYTAPDNVTICRGKKVCSAEPTIKGFRISVENLLDEIKIENN